MDTPVYKYSMTVKKGHLDGYHHVNNAAYLTFFEDARWDIITQNGYGREKIYETGLGPVILAITINFLKELREGDKILIESQMISYERKIGKMMQRMLRGEEICCAAEFTIGLFDLKERKLVTPTPDWLRGVGLPISGYPERQQD